MIYELKKIVPSQVQKECIENVIVRRKNIFARLPTGKN